MKAQRKGSNMLVAARLRAYDAAVASGASKEDAMKQAREINRKSLGKIRK